MWSEIKARFSLFFDESVRDLRSKCNKISQFFSSDGSVSGETFGEEEEKEKTSPKPNPLIAQPAQTDENKREKTKKMWKIFFCFLGATINLFNLIIRCFALPMGVSSGRARKSFGMFSRFDSVRRR